MTDEISYFEVASYLAEIEAEYAEISDPIERTQQLVARLQEKRPALTANRILEEYFGELLHASSYSWPAGLEAEIREHVLTDQTYESRVSHYLITALSQQQVFWFFLSAVVGLLLLGAYFGRRAPG